MTEQIEILTMLEVVDGVLPCPFCGEKPTVDKDYVPATVEITCNNQDCFVGPSIYESVRCVENQGETITYTPMFERHWKSILDKWNKRVKP